MHETNSYVYYNFHIKKTNCFACTMLALYMISGNTICKRSGNYYIATVGLAWWCHPSINQNIAGYCFKSDVEEQFVFTAYNAYLYNEQ